jgi:hypothetical protein
MVDNNCYITIGGHVHGKKFVVYPWAFHVPQSNVIYIYSLLFKLILNLKLVKLRKCHLMHKLKYASNYMDDIF